MTVHFAYPNVLKDQFIGCGRFASFEGAPEPGGYSLSRFDTPNSKVIDRTISALAPRSFHGNHKIYEKKDQDRLYRGDSMDLAYFLAFVSCSRRLTLTRAGDIWCTGLIEKEPALDKVKQQFGVKLDGFLADQNTDRVFIAPAANVKALDGGQEARLREKGVNRLTLDEFKQALEQNGGVFESKTIVSVVSNELPKLVDILFEPADETETPESAPVSKKIRLWISMAAILILALAIGVWRLYPDRAGVEEIRKHLENGELIKAARLLESADSPVSALMGLKESANRASPVSVRFQYQTPGSPPSDYLPLDSETLAGLELTHSDNYRIRIQSGPDDREIYLYAFQKDSGGSIDRIFPNPEWSGVHHNPVAYGDFPVRIPPVAGKWMYLDELSSGAGPSEETIYVAASPWRARDIERLYAEIHKQTRADERNKQLARFLGQLQIRSECGIPAVFYREFTFKHGR